VALPMVHTGWITAIGFSVLNAALLRTRITVENDALARLT
jgi:methyltransferase